MEASPTASTESNALSRELEGFLVQLAAALQRHSMYPAGHPALRPALGNVMECLGEAVVDAGALRIKITPDCLVVGGATTPAGHPLLGALAKRLHGHQLLSITLIADLAEKEISDFLTTIGVDPGLSASALGAAGAEELERWPNILIEPVPYEALSIAGSDDLADGVDAADATRFWTQVASPTANPDWTDPLGDLSLAEIKAALSDEPNAFDLLIEDQLPSVLDAWRGSDEAAAAVRQGISKLILKLKPDQLLRLLQMARTSGELDETDGAESEGIGKEAVQELIDASCDMSNEQVPVWLIRILTKIGMYAETAAHAPSHKVDGGLDKVVQQLAVGWNVADAKPEDYEEALGRLINTTPVLELGQSLLEEPRSERVVQLSLEIDDLSGSARKAAKAMLEEGELASLLDLLETAPAGSRVSETLWKFVAHPERVRELLRSESPDFATLDRLMGRVGFGAAEPMLETLIESELRAIRRELLNRLAGLGPDVGPLALDHVADERWDVRLNMLALLDRLAVWPEQFTPGPFLKDTEPRVRHEAIKLALKVPALREEAILSSLGEEEEHTIALGVAAAVESCPAAATPDVIRHALDSELSQGLRMRAVRALADFDSPEALRALIRLTWARRWIFWDKLAPVSPVMLTALSALAETWAAEPTAIRVLARATWSGDPLIRAAAGVEEEAE